MQTLPTNDMSALEFGLYNIAQETKDEKLLTAVREIGRLREEMGELESELRNMEEYYNKAENKANELQGELDTAYEMIEDLKATVEEIENASD